MRIRFLETVQLESGGRNVGPVFNAGEIHDLRIDQANRWIRRGQAEPAIDDDQAANLEAPIEAPVEDPIKDPAPVKKAPAKKPSLLSRKKKAD